MSSHITGKASKTEITKNNESRNQDKWVTKSLTLYMKRPKNKQNKENETRTQKKHTHENKQNQNNTIFKKSQTLPKLFSFFCAQNRTPTRSYTAFIVLPAVPRAQYTMVVTDELTQRYTPLLQVHVVEVIMIMIIIVTIINNTNKKQVCFGGFYRTPTR